VARLGKRNSTLSLVLAAVVAIAGYAMAHHSSSDSSDSSDSSHSAGGSRSSYSAGAASGDAGHAGTDSASGLPYVDLSSLPAQAADTVDLIDAGGPFPYPDHDDKTFGNYEGLLPEESSGYYKEYTVPTPHSPDRGARRIIKGADGTLYWTADHYEHFAVIKR